MTDKTYVGDIFIVVEINPFINAADTPAMIGEVYTNQYMADKVAWKKNQAAKEANIPHRWTVVCRSLYSF